MDQRVWAGGLAGIAGAGLLGGSIAGLTAAQWEFLRSLGWDPLRDPTMDWPSGLALGPYGWLMTGAFLGSGALLAIFGAGLGQALGPRPGPGPRLLALGGLALAGLAFPTDPTLSTAAPTLAGRLHDSAFVLFGLSFMAGWVALSLRMAREPRWRALARLGLAAAALAGPAFFLKGPFFYLFLAVAHAWVIAVAAAMLQAPD